MWSLFVRNYLISADTEHNKEFEQLILSTALSDLFFSHKLIYFLLAYYFYEEREYDEANIRIQQLLTNVISICRPRFSLSLFVPGIYNLRLNNPMKSCRQLFKIYYPMVRSIPQQRLDYLRMGKMSDQGYLEEMYMSSLNFWGDIVEIARTVKHTDPKPEKRAYIINKLRELNKNLPSFVFVPSASKPLTNPNRGLHPLPNDPQNRRRRNFNFPNKNQNQFHPDLPTSQTRRILNEEQLLND